MTTTGRPDPAALRRLLAAVPARDLPLSIYPDALEWEKEIIAADGDPVGDVYARDTEPAVDRAELIVVAVNALPALLDWLEAAEARAAANAEDVRASVRGVATAFFEWRNAATFLARDAPMLETLGERYRSKEDALVAALAGAGEGGRP